ncbi:TetR/AcrR family transcriptional regulator [Hoeflea sp. TYP-13]|uniref:TetR/AcrR family transcriptional regulator n=1 Tax=Hoeflea sp. TYP-13 TaxID=3230023 RepID=UPI0034C5BA05
MQDDIEQAAIGLFNEIGGGFTLDQLQARTGLSRATLYRRIGSKDALLNRLSDENLIRLDDSLDMDVRVFAAARKVVGEYGFLACTMEQIAKEAGIGIATLYRHFKDKESLLGRFVAEMGPKLVIRQTLESRDPDLERDLKQIIEIGLRFGHHNQDIAKIIFSMKPAERKYLAALRRDSVSTFSRLIQYLEKHQRDGVLRRDVSAEDLAMNLNGLLVQYSAFGPAYLDRPLDIERDTDAILKMFLQSARRAP